MNTLLLGAAVGLVAALGTAAALRRRRERERRMHGRPPRPQPTGRAPSDWFI